MSNRTVETVTADELATRRRILDLLRGYTNPRQPNVVHATEFQEVLDSMGLRFGADVVDRVMLLCNIDAGGMVRHVGVTCAAHAAGSSTHTQRYFISIKC